MQQDSSVAMTAPVLRSSQRTQSGVVLQIGRMTGGHLLLRNPLGSRDSPTGFMTFSASITAASGLTTATITSNTGPPVTAGATSLPAQVQFVKEPLMG